MTVQKNKPAMTSHNRTFFINELESLLLIYENTTGIAEPRHSNQLEDAGNYLVYLSKLAKQSGKHEQS